MQQEKMKNVTEYTFPLIPFLYLDREQWIDLMFVDCENSDEKGWPVVIILNILMVVTLLVLSSFHAFNLIYWNHWTFFKEIYRNITLNVIYKFYGFFYFHQKTKTGTTAEHSWYRSYKESVSMLVSGTDDCGFDFQLGQIKDFKMSICCFSASHSTQL